MKKEFIIYSPVDGKVKKLENVKDEVFSKKMVGVGIAVVPESSTIYSPIKGKIKVAFPTGHAFGIKSSSNYEILVHIGIDTVELNGEGFESDVEVNQKTNTKKVLANVDYEILKKNKKPSDVIVLVTNNTIGDGALKFTTSKEVKKGDFLFSISR